MLNEISVLIELKLDNLEELKDNYSELFGLDTNCGSVTICYCHCGAFNVLCY